MARVLPGQSWKPPRAEQQNRWDTSSEYWELRERLAKKIPDQRMPVPTEMDVIKVQNLTGAQRAESEVVQLGSEIISNITRLHPWLEGLTPDSRCARYAVLRYPTGINRIRWAQVSGPTLALVDLTNGHKRCSPKANTYHFVGDDDGPMEILWKPPETEGVHECLVEMEQVVPPSNYMAKLSINGIPARHGLTAGMAVCTIYKLEPHDYTGPEEKTLYPVLKPNFAPLTKAIYNISQRAIRSCGDDVFIPVHREECGNWFASDTVIRNTIYEAILSERLCPDNLGLHAIESVQPWESPEPANITALINQARNKYGRAARMGDAILIMRKFKEDSSGSGSDSGSASGTPGVCNDEFIIVQVLAQCRDIPVALESSCQDSGSVVVSDWMSSPDGDGRFLFREECDSTSQSESMMQPGGSGSDARCAPIRASIMRKMAIETCSDEPELVDQLELEMQDFVVDFKLTDGCPVIVSGAGCMFSSCVDESEDPLECEDCEDSASSPSDTSAIE